jgi:hypothetical protein
MTDKIEQFVGVISEQRHAFRGKFHEVKLPDDIDKANLGDAFYVTLPIGRVGAKSNNGRIYTQKVVEQIVDQVNSKRPEGRWGHLKQEERSTRYEVPAVRWLAAEIDEEGVAWGKCVPITSDAREHLRIAKLTNAPVGTSIYGIAEMRGNEVTSIDLETIDLASAPRVGVPITASTPQITSEMDTTRSTEMPDNSATDAQVLAEVTDLRTKNTTLSGQIAEMTSTISGVKAILGDVDVVKTVGEMKTEIAELRKQSLKSEADKFVAELVKVPVTTESGKALAEYVNTCIGELTEYKDLEEIKAKVKVIGESKTYLAVAKALVSEAAGGNITVEDENGKKAIAEITSESGNKLAHSMGLI